MRHATRSLELQWDAQLKGSTSFSSAVKYSKDVDFGAMSKTADDAVKHNSLESRVPCCASVAEIRCFSAVNQKWSDFLIQAVRRGIARYDMVSLGVKVQISGVKMNPMTGRMEMKDLVILNPEGYHSEHLAKVRTVIIHINMRKLIMSKGKHIELNHVEFQKVDIIYEKGIFSSNVDHVVNFIEGMESADLGFLGGALMKVEDVVAGTVAATTNFVSQEARHVVEGVAPARIRRMYSVVAGAAQEVLDDGAAVAGTTIVATTAAVSGAVHLTENAATTMVATTSEAAGQVASAAGSAVTAATNIVTMPFQRRQSSNRDLRRRPSTVMKEQRRRASLITASQQDLLQGADLEDKDKEEDSTDEDDHEEQDEWFVVHRVVAADITVRLASRALRGQGIELCVADRDYQDCSAQVEADSALDMARFLTKSLLQTVHQKVAHDLSFAANLTDDLTDVVVSGDRK
jgi:hypothetical protein